MPQPYLQGQGSSPARESSWAGVGVGVGGGAGDGGLWVVGLHVLRGQGRRRGRAQCWSTDLGLVAGAGVGMLMGWSPSRTGSSVRRGLDTSKAGASIPSAS